MTSFTAGLLVCAARWLRVGAVAAIAWPCIALAAGGTAKGEAIARQGANGAAACQTCHGQAGEGTAASGFPRLAALPAPYLARQLQAFAAGQRENPLMNAVAKALSPEDRAAVADYYASLPAPAAGAASASAAGSAPAGSASAGSAEAGSAAAGSAAAGSAGAGSAAAPSSGASGPAKGPSNGAVLASRGRWSEGLPACEQCHAPGGRGVGDSFPPLAGQPAAYIASQLRAWKAGKRPGGPMDLMAVVAKKLNDADIDSVAQHFASLPAKGGAR